MVRMQKTTPSAIAFLHTANEHIATFSSLLAKQAPSLVLTTLSSAHPELLDKARELGPDHPEIRASLEKIILALSNKGKALVVCTCSTLGAEVEKIGQSFNLPVLRIDRAMTEQAVNAGRRILILACLNSTLHPTTNLLQATAKDFGRTIEIQSYVVDDAWQYFLAGNQAAYLDKIEESLRSHAGDAEVVLLAQASMAPVAARCQDLNRLILSSPDLGVAAALRALNSLNARD